jgi:outer membrane protein assembly factor BamB
MRVRMALAVLVASSAPLSADDWPQWMGPKRDNVWREAGVLDKFPEGGPKVLWRTPVNGGYAGPAVSGGKVYCLDYRSPNSLGESNFDRKEANGEERVFALDEATGKLLWEHKYPVRYTISYPAGPRCTPLVHAGKVYFLGAEGDLLCCDAAKGDVLWKKNLRTEYQAKAALWGYAAHPQIIDGKLITLAGREAGHVVALNPDTGAEIWKSPLDAEQGYSPPLLIEAGGAKQLVCPAPNSVRALDPDTGKELWRTKYEATSGSIIMTPVRVGEYLYVAGYQGKNLMLKLASDRPAVEVLFKDKKGAGVSPVNVQPFAEDGVIYGHDESGKLFAVEVPSGKRLWESSGAIGGEQAPGSGTAFIVKNGDRFFFFNEKGELVIGKLSRDGYAEIDRAKVLEPTGSAFGRKVVWSMPAFADRHAYVRNDKELICVDLAK